MYPFTHIPLQTMQTHTQIPNHDFLVASDILHIFTNFQPWIPPQSKATLILSYSAGYPLPGWCNPEC